MRLSTQSPLDKLLGGGIENGAITNIYGPAGCGKSNIVLSCILSCINSGKKALFIDTEGSFSLERYKQMGGQEEQLKNIIFVDVHTWKDQCEAFHKLEQMINNKIGLITVDSMVALYRLELDRENFTVVNKQLATHYSILSKIARTHNLPILVTTQVYTIGGEIEMTSRAISQYWSKALIELKKSGKENQRTAIIRKHRSLPEGQQTEFEIHEKGLKGIGKFF